MNKVHVVWVSGPEGPELLRAFVKKQIADTFAKVYNDAGSKAELEVFGETAQVSSVPVVL